MHRIIVGLLVIASVCLSGGRKETKGKPPSGPRADLSSAQSWGLQLQGADISEVAASNYDIVAIDYSKDGTDAGAYSYNEIESVRNTGKVVLAYMSLGEASDFRFYWQGWGEGDPPYIGPENPNYPGVHKVKYWKRAWWNQVVRPYLDRILDAGFDGVCLDGIDAYWFWYLQGEDPVQSADRMAALVRKVAEYARSRAGEDFVVCPNNGLAMLDDASPEWRDKYLADIDAVAVESLFYNYFSTEDQAYRLWKLEQFAAAGKKILNAEYIDSSLFVEYFDTLAMQSFEILGYPAHPDRLLDELIEY
ncbi:MAG: MJ1477/TM1410 family putative glycoside hydrolase [Planctomycetota bacterium]|jgi:cysteinyl-tRNA synthetase